MIQNGKRYIVTATVSRFFNRNMVCFKAAADGNSGHFVVEEQYSKNYSCIGNENHGTYCWNIRSLDVSELPDAITEKTCECDIMHRGCNCGVFAKEMEQRGFFYNKLARIWARK